MRKKVAIPLVLVAAVAGGWWLWRQRQVHPAGDLLASGTVEATEAQLGFQAPGRIESIACREGDSVAAGQELARLDTEELAARREQALAQVATAKSQLQELERGFRSEEIGQARAARDAARQRRQDAERDVDRTRRLFEGGAVSREVYDKAELALELATSQLTQAEEQLRLLEAGPRSEQVEARRAQLAQAQAAVKVLDASLANMALNAPFSGLVTERHREPGEIVAAGSPVLTLIDLRDRWVRIYVPETAIGAIAIGQRAEITSDTYPDKRYAGEVVFIASEAEFTPKTVQTQEERVRLVYAVKVRIVEDEGFELKPGLPVDVQLEAAPRPDDQG